MGEIEKILYLLNFNKNNTLIENYQNFSIKKGNLYEYKLLQEQWYNDPKHPEWKQYAPTDYEKRELQKSEDIVKRWKAIDHHDLLMWTSFALNFLGPYGQAAGLGLDVINSIMYHNEGNDFEAGLQLFFSLIPAAELARQIPGVKKFGKKFFERILLKTAKGELITKVERDAMEELLKGKKWLKNEATKIIFRYAIRVLFTRFTFPDLVKFIWLFSMKHPVKTFLGRIAIEYLGVTYTWGQLAKILNITEQEEFSTKSQVSNSTRNGIIKKGNESLQIIKDTASEQLGNEFSNLPEEVQTNVFNDIVKKIIEKK